MDQSTNLLRRNFWTLPSGRSIPRPDRGRSTLALSSSRWSTAGWTDGKSSHPWSWSSAPLQCCLPPQSNILVGKLLLRLLWILNYYVQVSRRILWHSCVPLQTSWRSSEALVLTCVVLSNLSREKICYTILLFRQPLPWCPTSWCTGGPGPCLSRSCCRGRWPRCTCAGQCCSHRWLVGGCIQGHRLWIQLSKVLSK